MAEHREEKGKMTVEEAGRLGGEARKQELGHAGYAEFGKKGGETLGDERGPEHFSEIGKKGGERVRELTEKHKTKAEEEQKSSPKR